MCSMVNWIIVPKIRETSAEYNYMSQDLEGTICHNKKCITPKRKMEGVRQIIVLPSFLVLLLIHCPCFSDIGKPYIVHP